MNAVIADCWRAIPWEESLNRSYLEATMLDEPIAAILGEIMPFIGAKLGGRTAAVTVGGRRLPSSFTIAQFIPLRRNTQPWAPGDPFGRIRRILR